jgi:hypothetical protein
MIAATTATVVLGLIWFVVALGLAVLMGKFIRWGGE